MDDDDDANSRASSDAGSLLDERRNRKGRFTVMFNAMDVMRTSTTDAVPARHKKAMCCFKCDQCCLNLCGGKKSKKRRVCYALGCCLFVVVIVVVVVLFLVILPESAGEELGGAAKTKNGANGDGGVDGEGGNINSSSLPFNISNGTSLTGDDDLFTWQAADDNTTDTDTDTDVSKLNLTWDFPTNSSSDANSTTLPTTADLNGTSVGGGSVPPTTAPTIDSLLDGDGNNVMTANTTNTSIVSPILASSVPPTMSLAPSTLTINGTADSSIIIDVNGTSSPTASPRPTLRPTSSSMPTFTNGSSASDSNGTSFIDSNEIGLNVNGTTNSTTNLTLTTLTTLLNSLSAPYTMTHLIKGSSSSALSSSSATSNKRLLQATTTTFPSQFGFSVAMAALDTSTMLFAIGAKEDTNELGVPTGAVYLYTLPKDTTTTTMTLLQTIYGTEANDEFGNALDLSHDGSLLIVGARSANGQTGQAYIYQRQQQQNDDDGTSTSTWAVPDDTSWIIQGQVPGGRAGWSVTMSDDGTVVGVGAPKGGSDGQGSIHLHKYDNSTSSPVWISYGSIIPDTVPDSGSEAAGYSISLSEMGNTIVVGYPKASNPNEFITGSGLSNAGKSAVYSYYNNDNATTTAAAAAASSSPSWMAVGSPIYGEGENDIEGTAVAVSNDGTTIVIGSKGYNNSTGKCRVYKLDNTASATNTNQWVYEASIVGAESDERLSTSVAISADGSVVACGGVNGVRVDGVVSSKSGVVRVLNLLTNRTSTIWPRMDDDDSSNNADGASNVTSLEGVSFGMSLAVSSNGEYVVVGAPTWDNEAGAIQVFRDAAN